MISKKANNDDGKQLIRIQREIEIMKKARHPFITELYEVYENDDFVFLVMEYSPNGTILNHIRDIGAYSEHESAVIFSQLILAMKHLQRSCNVAHRDLKAENILFDIHQNIRVIDFGLSNSPNDDNLMNTQCGSLDYASPEMILGKQYIYSSDIWSAGVVLFAMTTGHLPFEDSNMSRLAQRIIFKEIDYPTNLSRDLLDLLKKMLVKDPNQRINLDEIMRHPWLHTAIQYVNETINKFEYDNIKITEQLRQYGVRFEDVVLDLSNNRITPNTAIYSMIRRQMMTKGIVDMRNAEEILKRRGSLCETVVLPRLIKAHTATRINRKSLPIPVRLSRHLG